MNDTQDKTKTEEIKTATANEQAKKAEVAKTEDAAKDVSSYKAGEKDAK